MFLAAVAGGAVVVVSGAASALPAKRIAILASPGDNVSRTDTEHFIARIGNRVVDVPGYALVARARIAAVLQEQGFSNSAYADPQTAAKLGKVLGATAILHVTLSVEIEDSSGALLTTQTVTAASDYELIAVSTAQIVANGSAEGTEERRAARGGTPASTLSAVRRAAIEACAAALVEKLSLR